MYRKLLTVLSFVLVATCAAQPAMAQTNLQCMPAEAAKESLEAKGYVRLFEGKHATGVNPEVWERPDGDWVLITAGPTVRCLALQGENGA